MYYPDDYGPYVGTLDSGFKPSRLGLIVRRILGSGAQVLPDLLPGRVLEIGCASGSFLRRLEDDGWTVEGIEFSESAAEASRALGFRVHTGRVEEAPDPCEPFDLCVGWMVLEHLHEPVAALRKLWSWTRPGGWLVMSVPDAGAVEFSIFRQYWYALQVPNHLFHLDPSTATRMLSMGGWKVARVMHQRSVANLMGSIGLLLREKRWFPTLAGRLVGYPVAPPVFHRLMLPLSYALSALGQTGRMTIWARREENPTWAS